ncbi:hypothetical protein Barb4_00891 [Bacteroidales bacterium Barb4]|nr:hypothetical protein Barb4_00891 [Bacteroidales bacterium Barb4]
MRQLSFLDEFEPCKQRGYLIMRRYIVVKSSRIRLPNGLKWIYKSDFCLLIRPN